MTDRDILQGLDFPTPCQATNETCTYDATCYSTCTHCGYASPTCGWHRTATTQYLFLAALGHYRLHCNKCQTPMRHVNAIRFEPIGSPQ